MITIREWNKENRKLISDLPGAYVIRLEKGEYYYIGSSRNLVARLRRFFGAGGQSLVAKGIKFYTEVYLFDSVNEAVFKECELIREHQPIKNTALKSGF